MEKKEPARRSLNPSKINKHTGCLIDLPVGSVCSWPGTMVGTNVGKVPPPSLPIRDQQEGRLTAGISSPHWLPCHYCDHYHSPPLVTCSQQCSSSQTRRNPATLLLVSRFRGRERRLKERKRLTTDHQAPAPSGSPTHPPIPGGGQARQEVFSMGTGHQPNCHCHS